MHQGFSAEASTHSHDNEEKLEVSHEDMQLERSTQGTKTKRYPTIQVTDYDRIAPQAPTRVEVIHLDVRMRSYWMRHRTSILQEMQRHSQIKPMPLETIRS